MGERAGKKSSRLPQKTCEITRSKSETYRMLEGVIAVPRLYASLAEVDVFPVFVKPDRGQGSIVLLGPMTGRLLLQRLI